MKAKGTCIAVLLALASAGLVACQSTPVQPVAQADKDYLRQDAEGILQVWDKNYPEATARLKEAYAYAIFPNVTKGAIGIGGAYGRGMVYEQGNLIGYADLSQATVGAQLGGQSYSELILFRDRFALEHFKRGNMEFAAQASAIAANKAASTDVNYENGVLVFTSGRGGLMFEAAIGGQKFRFEPAT
ncbi:MAG: hypothetical protein WD768_06180 [Phycisphaeraceae bacterium]